MVDWKASWIAWVEPDSEYPPPVIHYKGLPEELSGGDSLREELAWPRVLIIFSLPEGGFLLYRFSADRDPCGDTWHKTVEDAKHQARYEYGKLVSDWREVPQEIEDPVTFAFEHQP